MHSSKFSMALLALAVGAATDLIDLRSLQPLDYDSIISKVEICPIWIWYDLVQEFMKIVEKEALSLHAMMMSSDPYFILMKPNTLEIINSIWAFRKATQIPVCFTLDAGANVHVLYPKQYTSEVEHLIKDELSVYCQNGQYILDHVGLGAEPIKI